MLPTNSIKHNECIGCLLSSHWSFHHIFKSNFRIFLNILPTKSRKNSTLNFAQNMGWNRNEHDQCVKCKVYTHYMLAEKPISVWMQPAKYSIFLIARQMMIKLNKHKKEIVLVLFLSSLGVIMSLLNVPLRNIPFHTWFTALFAGGFPYSYLMSHCAMKWLFWLVRTEKLSVFCAHQQTSWVRKGGGEFFDSLYASNAHEYNNTNFVMSFRVLADSNNDLVDHRSKLFLHIACTVGFFNSKHVKNMYKIANRGPTEFTKVPESS